MTRNESVVGHITLPTDIEEEELVTQKSGGRSRRWQQIKLKVSKHFHRVFNGILRLLPLLLANPTPMPPNNSCSRWKWFEGSLGPLDGTYIDVHVKAEDRARLKAKPHISSKIHVWKKTYNCINDMMGRSGFGWCQTTNTIDVKDDVFYNFAKKLRYKSFAYYAQWCEVFGKDRATGQRGFDPILSP
ncbi:UNVERIFIED_CONTAM: hypothetical protein Scaly_1664900 [Sesamum calycinum]|uniref:Myb/SANT-like domain-containing protein n=1 Tax=Sesamum calycinum TaxID=2727403 RepID=A0AAW2NRS5_9LAMI